MKASLLLITALLSAIGIFSGCATHITLPRPTDSIRVSRVIDKDDSTETITGLLNGKSITATVKFAPYDANTSSSEPHGFWLGNDDRSHIPKYVVDRLSIWKNGNELPIPRELYSNFSDFKLPSYTLHFYEAENGFYLRFSGSDGAGSYTGYFLFDEQGLQQMFVQENEIAYFRLKDGKQDDSTKIIQFPTRI